MPSNNPKIDTSEKERITLIIKKSILLNSLDRFVKQQNGIIKIPNCNASLIIPLADPSIRLLLKK